MMKRLITLLTDFGLHDVYVGVMKGVILQIYPSAMMIDLTHTIPPQNIGYAAFCLQEAYPHFPPNTIHLAIVDPGVGSERRGVAIQLKNGFLVGPDNGLFSRILAQESPLQVIELNRPESWRNSQPSSTFHGRDIFAPIVGHLAKGASLKSLGKPIDPESLVNFPFPKCIPLSQGYRGIIQYSDHFGNLVTNIPAEMVQGKKWVLTIKEFPLLKIASYQTYAQAQTGDLMSLIGSHGWVEIAVNCGNAKKQLGLEIGREVDCLIQFA